MQDAEQGRKRLQAESGVQLAARLWRRVPVPLKRAYAALLVNGPLPPAGATLELCGPSGAGKSRLAAEVAGGALLPARLGGCGAGVLLLRTDGGLRRDALLAALRGRVIETQGTDSTDDVLEEILPNLLVADVYDGHQLLVTIENLDTVLTDNPNISLMIVDTLTAFYWSDQGLKLTRMDSYLNNLLRNIQKVTKEHGTTILYTRPQYFSSKQDGVENLQACLKEPTLGNINYRIHLSKLEDQRETFHAIVETWDNSCVKKFMIKENKITWL